MILLYIILMHNILEHLLYIYSFLFQTSGQEFKSGIQVMDMSREASFKSNVENTKRVRKHINADLIKCAFVSNKMRNEMPINYHIT